MAKVHPTALIEEGVDLDGDVHVDAGAIIRAGVKIGEGSYVGPYCIIGERLSSYYEDPKGYMNPKTRIGRQTVIRSHSVVYASVTIGERFVTGSRVFIRERTIIGDNVVIGTLTEVMPDCVIEGGVRIHSGVFVPERTHIKENARLFPHVVLTNDLHPPCGKCLTGPTVGEGSVIGAAAVVLPHVVVGSGSLIAAGAIVVENVPPETLVVGVPARVVKKVREIKCRWGCKSPYPWSQQK